VPNPIIYLKASEMVH